MRMIKCVLYGISAAMAVLSPVFADAAIPQDLKPADSLVITGLIGVVIIIAIIALVFIIRRKKK